jgi:hypothetical protein
VVDIISLIGAKWGNYVGHIPKGLDNWIWVEYFADYVNLSEREPAGISYRSSIINKKKNERYL